MNCNTPAQRLNELIKVLLRGLEVSLLTRAKGEKKAGWSTMSCQNYCQSCDVLHRVKHKAVLNQLLLYMLYVQANPCLIVLYYLSKQ